WPGRRGSRSGTLRSPPPTDRSAWTLAGGPSGAMRARPGFDGSGPNGDARVGPRSRACVGRPPSSPSGGHDGGTMWNQRRGLHLVATVAILLSGPVAHAGQITFTFGLTRSLDACEDTGARI